MHRRRSSLNTEILCIYIDESFLTLVNHGEMLRTLEPLEGTITLILEISFRASLSVKFWFIDNVHLNRIKVSDTRTTICNVIDVRTRRCIDLDDFRNFYRCRLVLSARQVKT